MEKFHHSDQDKKYNICCLQFHEVGRDRVDFGSSENSLPLAALGWELW
jgi:hypothetical protein